MEAFLVSFPEKKVEQNQFTSFTVLTFRQKKYRATFYLRLFWIHED